MTPTKVLNKTQAEAVYSAMCALNNVGGKVKAMFGDVSTEGINVFESAGEVHVAWVRTCDVLHAEIYPDRSAFATAYGLHQG